MDLEPQPMFTAIQARGKQFLFYFLDMPFGNRNVWAKTDYIAYYLVNICQYLYCTYCQ